MEEGGGASSFGQSGSCSTCTRFSYNHTRI